MIAGMLYENNRRQEKTLLDWEKVNALEHRQKDDNAQKENLDSRVGCINGRVTVIEDRSIYSTLCSVVLSCIYVLITYYGSMLLQP